MYYVLHLFIFIFTAPDILSSSLREYHVWLEFFYIISNKSVKFQYISSYHLLRIYKRVFEEIANATLTKGCSLWNERRHFVIQRVWILHRENFSLSGRFGSLKPSQVFAINLINSYYGLPASPSSPVLPTPTLPPPPFPPSNPHNLLRNKHTSTDISFFGRGR